MNINTDEYQPISLEDLGWNSFFQKNYQLMEIPDSVPARVITGSRESFQVYMANYPHRLPADCGTA